MLVDFRFQSFVSLFIEISRFYRRGPSLTMRAGTRAEITGEKQEENRTARTSVFGTHRTTRFSVEAGILSRRPASAGKCSVTKVRSAKTYFNGQASDQPRTFDPSTGSG